MRERRHQTAGAPRGERRGLEYPTRKKDRSGEAPRGAHAHAGTHKKAARASVSAGTSSGIRGNQRSPFPAAVPSAEPRGGGRRGAGGGGSAAEGARRGGRAPRIPPAAAMPLPKAEPAKPVNWQQFAYLWCLLPFSVIALQAGKVTEKYITPSKKTAKRLIRAQGL